MKSSSIISVIALGALSSARGYDQRRLGRGGWGGRHSGGGHGGGGGHHGGGEGGEGGKRYGIYSMVKANCYWGANESQPLLERLQEECDSNFPCLEVTPGDCSSSSWETVDENSFMLDGCPTDEEPTADQKEEYESKMQEKRDKWNAMTDLERETYKEQKQAAKSANAATVLGCGCCTDDGIESVADLVKGKEGAVARTLGFRKPRGDGEGGHGFGGHGDIDSMLERKCPAFEAAGKCDTMAAYGIDCEEFEAGTMKRGRRKGYMLYCGCCDVD